MRIPCFIDLTYSQRAAQRQVLAASAGIGGKMQKGEPAFGAESPQVWATPALVRCKRCWALFARQEFTLCW